MTKYNIYNPYTARRVIYSALEGSRPIEILPKASVENVELADHVAENLMLRHEKDPDNELRLDIVTESDVQPAMKMTIDESKIDVIRAKGKR